MISFCESLFGLSSSKSEMWLFAFRILQTFLNLGARSLSFFLHRHIIVVSHLFLFFRSVPPIQIVSSSGCATMTRTFFFFIVDGGVLIK